MTIIYAGWTLDASWWPNHDALMYRNHHQLWNLAWLMHPELDKFAGQEYQPGAVLPCATTLLNSMDKGTWAALSNTPEVFMDHFSSIDTGDLAMVQHLSGDYRKVMEVRAAKAQRLLFPTLSDNVVHVDFKKGKIRASA